MHLPATQDYHPSTIHLGLASLTAHKHSPQVNLFVERCHLLWKAPQVQTWLKKACDRAVDIADGKQEVGAGRWALRVLCI